MTVRSFNRLSFLISAVLCLLLFGCSKNSNYAKVDSKGDFDITPSLTNQNVSVFLEDREGFIWIGTEVGLNRFDGESYYNFLSSPSDSLSLSHSKICTIFQDSKGQIWVGTRLGVNRLRSDMKWDSFSQNSTSSNIFDIYENSKGEVFAGNRWSLLKCEPENMAFNEVMTFVEYQNLYSKTCLDSEDGIWLVQDHLIAQYNGDTYEKIRTIDVEEPVICSLMDGNDRLWLLHDHNVELFDTRRFCFEPIPSGVFSIPQMLSSGMKSMFRYKGGFVFVGKDDTLYFYDTNKSTLYSDVNYSNYNITTYFMDSNGNSWVGYSNKGYAFRNNANRLSAGEIQIQQNLLGTSISNLAKGHDGNLWVLSNNTAITVLDGKSNAVIDVDASEVLPHTELSKTVIESILPDAFEDNRVWVLSYGVLYYCALGGDRLKCLKSFRTDADRMQGLFQDKHGRVFIYGQGSYVYYVNKGSAELNTILVSDITLTQVTDMVQTEDGDVLLCCNYRPIYQIDFEQGNVKSIISRERSVFEPTCMISDSEGKIWVTANGTGIMRFEPGQDTFDTIQFDASHYNNSIIEGGEYMWIGSHNGLYRYEKATGKYNVYYAGDVIVGNQFNSHSACRLDNGNMVFGGSNGITIFNPKYDARIEDNVPLAIEFIQSGESYYVAAESVAEGKSIVLNSDENDITIHYSALNYNEYLHLRYEFKMDGIDNDWHYVHASREAHYANLPYGKNTFRLRVVGPARVETGLETSLVVYVKRPLLICRVAQIVYALLASLIILLFYRMQKRNREKDIEKELISREKEQQVLLNEKNIDYFTSISHEFRTPLTMILASAESFMEEEKRSTGSDQYSKILYRNVRRMQKLVDQLLDVSKLENGSLKLSAKLMDILPKAKEIVDAFRFSTKFKGIDISFDCHEDTMIGYLDEDAFEKIMYNLLSNAVKYTPQGGNIRVKVDVVNYDKAVDKFRVASDDNYIRIKVIDSGVGIPEDKRDVIFNKYYQVQTNKSIGGTGIGLYFTKMLVNLHHGDVVCEASRDNDGNEISGTQFTFILPLNEKSYTQNEISDQSPVTVKANPTVLSEYVEPSPTVDTEDSDKPIVLAIDDDPEVLHYIKTLLSPYYRMVLRFDATTGYEAIGQFSPDIIISDVLMLDIDGFEFCRMVKDNAEYSHIPLILLTAKTATEDQIKGMEVHADAYVTKPFDPNFLKALIKSTLEKKAEAKKVLAASTISTKERLEEVLKEKDREFMEALYKFMESELENEELNVTAIYEQMYMSRTKFYNKIKSLTGDTPANFFRTYKLNRAKEILETGEYKIAAVAVMTGFCSASHFSTLFKKQFGITPTEFLSGKPIQ